MCHIPTEFKIDATAIKRPSSFRIERFNITTLHRLASAKMVGDLVARKRKFYFTYDQIDSRQMDVILSLLWTPDELFHTLSYVENNVVKTAEVYVGSIPTLLHRTGGLWVWKDVSFDLIEQ